MPFNKILHPTTTGVVGWYGTYTQAFSIAQPLQQFFSILNVSYLKLFCHFSAKKLYISSISQVFRKVIAWRRFIDNFFFFILQAKQKMISFLNILILCHLRFSDISFNYFDNSFHIFLPTYYIYLGQRLVTFASNK